MAKVDEKLLMRLQQAIENCQEDLRPFRETRRKCVSQAAGYRYGSGATMDHTAVNHLDQMLSIYQRILIPENPRVRVESKHEELRFSAWTLEKKINEWISTSDYQDHHARCVQDSLFGIGVKKSGVDAETGEPFSDHVEFDSFGFDTRARRWEDVQFTFDEYVRDYEDAVNDESYGASFRRNLQASEDDSTNGDAGVPRLSDLTTRGRSSVERLRDVVRLRDVYLRHKGCVVTLAVDGDPTVPAKVTEWTGSESGPHRMLFYGRIPDNLMPPSIAANLMDLHHVANMSFNVCYRGAANEKSVGMVQGGQESDAQALNDAEDGQYIRVNTSQPVVESRIGGVNQATMAFVLWVEQLFNRMAGQLDVLGGLSPVASTYGAEELLHKAANANLRRMQQSVMRFTRDDLYEVARTIWESDEIFEMSYSPPSMPDRTAFYKWGPDDRRADFVKLNFEIDPYSWTSLSPAEELAAINNIMSQIVIPLMPLMSQQGISIDFQSLMKRLSRLSNIRSLDEIIVLGGSSPPGADAAPSRSQIRGMKSPNTTRTINRVNRPGAGSGSQNAILMQSLMGVNRQPKEKASLYRSVG